MFGFLNVYKPKGKTSHDVVAILRRLTKVKQIGHTGTLDPFAEGVLPICIGKATRLIEYLADDKAYVGTVKLGVATTTYDTEGEVVKTSEGKITRDDLENILDKFRGEIEQVPPIYSAIKVNGKKLYEYARKGEEVKIEPRRVTIFRLDLLSFDYENQTAELYIECSKGTYIRSIANDLGEVLGVGGHLIKLVRVKAGDFVLEHSVRLEDMKDAQDVERYLKSPIEYLNYPKYEINDAEKAKVSNGVSVCVDGLPDGVAVLTYHNEVAAVVSVSDGVAKTLKVFV